ncbi:MAG: response regulator transcription factor [Planctomycetota bacterium]|jgi:FixJ family two-component response regulator
MLNIKPTVYIVDDDENVRESLAQLISAVGYNIKAFSSAQEFLDSYDSPDPGCLVLDIRMPEISGLGLQENLAESRDILPIIFITGHGDVATATEAFKGGAVDFIEKPFSDQKLLDSINKAIDLSLGNYKKQLKIADIKKRMDSLTPREHQILEGVVEGKTNKIIAIELGLSPKTVDFHRCHILEKMGVNSAVQLTRAVMKASGS